MLASARLSCSYLFRNTSPWPHVLDLLHRPFRLLYDLYFVVSVFGSLSSHSTTSTRTRTPTPTRPTRLHPYVRYARFPRQYPPMKSASVLHSTTPTPTPTSSPTSSRGSSRECRRVIQLAAGITSGNRACRTCRRRSSRGCRCRRRGMRAKPRDLDLRTAVVIGRSVHVTLCMCGKSFHC